MRTEEHVIPSERAEIKVGVDSNHCVWIVTSASNGHFANIRFTSKEALAHASTVVDAVNNVHRECGLHEYEIRQVPAPKHDPRPDNMTELARLVAIELRRRGIWARANRGWVDIDRHTARFRAYVLYNPDFDHLGPIGCANAIQAEEAKRAQEWASDT